MYQLTCSIVLFNSDKQVLQQAIDSVLACTLPLRLFLVDNSPADTLKTVAANERVEYIFNDANVGYGAGHNIAIRRAMPVTKYHLVLNPDVSFNNGTLETIYNFMEANPGTGHVMPTIKYPDGSLQYTCKLLPTPFDLIFRRFLPAALIKQRTAYFEMHSSGYNKIMEVPYLSGCFMFLRIAALEKAGLFDECFFMYPEDIDLTRRIRRFYKTIFFPGAEIVHRYERGSYKNLDLLWIHITNMIKYFNKWGWVFDKERRQVNRQTLSQFNTV